MKLKRLLFLLTTCILANLVQGQNLLDSKVQLEITSGTRHEFLLEIESKMEIDFSYNPKAIGIDEEVEVNTTEGTLKELLTQIFADEGISFVQRGTGKVLIIKKKESNDGQSTLYGYVKDDASGEVLIGATISARSINDPDKWYGVAANSYGFYSLTIPTGQYHLKVSYVGYVNHTETTDATHDQTLYFELSDGFQLEEVVVESSSFEEAPEHNYASNDMGKTTLDVQTIRKMPALFGEVDVIKAVQLLPGVQVQGEGSTNFFVRGGNSDQNLIQLDEATVYNASHLMGFFSVFNPDALNYMQFYRGHIPAEYGGRLSSLLDVRMKEGNNKKFGVSGGLGITSSRLTLERPLQKERSSFILSGRRTYLDQFFRLSADDLTRDTRIYFYDLNAKFNYKINDRNKIFLSGYFGRDLNKILVLQYIIDWGNATGTFRWNHIFNDRLFSNTTLLYSKYDYLIDLSDEDTPFNWRSKIEDITFKEDLSLYVNPDHLLSFGLQSTLHQFVPGESKEDPKAGVPRKKALESAIYLSSDQKLTKRLSFNYGLRFSLYQLFGETTLFQFDENDNIIGERQTASGKFYQTYSGLEPRFSARYLLNNNNSVKFSYNRNRQYMQLLSNLALGFNVFDIWYPASNHIKPQTADQLSFGYFQNLKNNQYELSAEVYYKNMDNQVDYADHLVLIMNRELEAGLRTGKGEAYGIELMAKKNGRLNGWASYNYSRAKRKIDGINDGEVYPALYDQPHNFSLVGNYQLNKRWAISANWNFASGRPVSLPEESFRFENHIVPVYGDKNDGRLPDYHRLDLSFTLLPKNKPNRKNQSSWNFSFYNLYSRFNAASVFVTSELKDIDLVRNSDKTAFHKLSLFGIIPSVTYNFKF